MLVSCACGCKKQFYSIDSENRTRKYISGHNTIRKYEDPTQYKREWNHRNRPARRAYKAEYHRTRKVKLLEYKGNECEKCGIKYDGTNAAIFHFHHLRDKTLSLGNKLTAKAWKTLIEEADKCILLCANCHELKHSKEF
jgi:hypothetical protein